MRYLASLALITVLAAAAAAQQAPTPTPPVNPEMEMRQMMEGLRLLERLQEFAITPQQAQAALPWLKKAEDVRQQIQPFEDETVQSLRSLIDKARADIAAGQPIPPVIRTEMDVKMRELQERRQQVRAQLELGAWAIVNTLTPEQVALLGEPEGRREMRLRLTQMLDTLRAIPGGDAAADGVEMLRRFLPEGREVPEPVRQQWTDTLAKARGLNDADYAAQRRDLVAALLAQVPAARWGREEAPATDAQRQDQERQRAVRTLAEMLNAPGMAQFIEARAAAKP